MAFTPDSPFPKSRGHVIKSKDWNDAITEVQRLDNAKVNKAGDNITGSLTIDGNAGVGITSPQAKLHVAGGGVRWGNNSELVIDQGGGIELGGNSTTAGTGTPYIDFHFSGLAQDFNTRIINDANGRLSLVAPTLQASGNVGIGTPTPADRLDVAGNLRILTGSNPIRFTSGWSGFPDSANNQAEISNDTGTYKTLMIIGNRSAGLGPGQGRRVSVWDRLEVNGTLIGNGNVGIGLADPGFRLDVADRIRLRQGGSSSAGLWLHQTAPNQDRAFIGMRDDTSVGLYGNTGAGWGMFMNTGNGDVTIPGRLGTGGWSPTPRQAGWGGGIHTWDIEAEATIWSRNAVQTGPRDLAENFSSDMDLDPGDVVCMGDEVDSIVVSEEPNDGLVLGVVSSEPGFLLNVDRDVEDDGLFPVALCGRVPCKVVDENGPIARGDFLTTSSTPGHAMKASSAMMDGREIHRPGTIIGKALGSFESGTGTIEVFVTSR
jgi:hypothetical protein